MAVITISREFGSNGKLIAAQTAQQLGYPLADKRTIERVLIQYGFVEFRDEYDTVPGFWKRFDERRTEMIGMLDRVIQALAHHGNLVILGRGSFAVLRNFADVLNVRLQASMPVRVKRVMAQQNIDDFDQAEAVVKDNDRLRITFVESFYNTRWNSTENFDLVIDTGKVPSALAVAWLVQTAGDLNRREAGEQQKSDQLQVDSILAAVVSEVLSHQ